MNYKIIGDILPVVEIELNQDESVICESGAMAWMSPNVEMKTTTNGGIGKMFGRMFSGDTLMQNKYTALNSRGVISFASCFPGNIKAFEISAGNEMILQKSAFLASETGVELSAYLSKKASSGFFGGEGFILQKVTGNGLVFVEIDGCLVEKELAADEEILISTGHLAAMSATCKAEVRSVGGVKNMVLGGEGIFNSVVKGPGKVYLQTLTIENMAGRLIPFMPTK